MKTKKEKPDTECSCCGWRGSHCDLINPLGYDRDYFQDGACCPKCESHDVGDIIEEEES